MGNKEYPVSERSSGEHAPAAGPFRRRIRTGIRGRILFLLLMILLPAFTLQSFFFYDRYHSTKTQEFQNNQEVAHMLAGAFEAFIQDVHLQELAVGIALSASPPLSSPDVNRLLLETADDFPCIRSISRVGPDGRITVSSNSLAVDEDISHRPFFREMAAGRSWIVSDLFEDRVTAEPVFVIGRAILGKDGGFLGTVIAEVLADRLDGVLTVQRPGHGSVSLTDSTGMLVYHHPRTMSKMEARDWIRLLPDGGRELFVAEYSGVLVLPYDNHRQITATKPILSIGWIAAACSREDEVMRPITGILIREGSLFLLVAITSFFASLVLSHGITGPIKRLQRHALSLSQGNMETRAGFSGPSEIQDFATVFNQMAGQIRTWMEKAEQRAMEAEEEKRVLDALMEHVPEGIAIADSPDVRIRRMSRYGQDEFGNHTGIIERSPLAQYYRKDSVFHMDGLTPLGFDELPIVRAVKKGEVTEDLELIMRKPDGSESVILCNAGPIRNVNGEETGGVVAWRDITARKRMEDDLRRSRTDLEQRVRERTAELERAVLALKSQIQMRRDAEAELKVHAAKLELSNREMQDFVFIASHDLQEPIRKLQTLSDVLSIKCPDGLSDDCLDYVARIRMSAKRMQDLLSSLLSYSRIWTKGAPLVEVALSDSLREALSNLEAVIKDTGGSIALGDLPALEADSGQMIQLLQHLLQNALKFHREGVAPEVKIYSRPLENGGSEPGAYRIFVEDNGIGFDEKYADRIFLPFERLHATDSYGGVGMGLTMCKKIVERHNGSITARSALGKGSIFIVTLPARQK